MNCLFFDTVARVYGVYSLHACSVSVCVCAGVSVLFVMANAHIHTYIHAYIMHVCVITSQGVHVVGHAMTALQCLYAHSTLLHVLSTFM